MRSTIGVNHRPFIASGYGLDTRLKHGIPAVGWSPRRAYPTSNRARRAWRVKASQLKLTEDSVAKVDVVSTKNDAADLKRFFPSMT